MKIVQKDFWVAVVGGMLLGWAFTISAFAEPTASPASTTSYPPVNVGPDTQYRTGRIGIGDGTNLPDQTLTDLNTLYTKGIFSTESLNVSNNATLVGDVEVRGRFIVAGAIRSGQVVIKGSSNGSPNGESLYFAPNATTNLLMGNTCTVTMGTACPAGTFLYKSEFSNQKSTCKYINPVASPGNIGSC